LRAKSPLAIGLVLIFGLSCKRSEVPESDFYGNQIQPVFNTFCVGNTSPCHRIDTKSGVALGNLDLTSFEAVHKRPDVLRTYGTYPEPLLLLKSIPENSTHIPYRGETYASEIRHVGGKTLSVDSDAFFELKAWLANGATRTGLPDERSGRTGQGACNGTLPPENDGLTPDRNSPAYKKFLTDVAPVLASSCSYSNCHGSPQSDFYLTCGSTDAQRDFNFLRAASFVTVAPDNVEQSELLKRPLAASGGGVNHTGGAFFQSKNDGGWKNLRDFAKLVQTEAPIKFANSMGEAFFGAHVMPVLIRRGCALETCHSPNGFNDFRLRPGALGFLSPFAIRRNYEATLHEFMNLDSSDVRMSRMVRKNILPSDGGIAHRGGPILQSTGENIQTPCPPFAAATASAFCTIKEWHRLERIDHAATVSALALDEILPIVYVSRPPNPDSLVQFDTFRGGADLIIADAHVGADGGIATVDNPRSLLAGCAGLVAGPELDVRGPEFSVDGARVVFAARMGAAGGLDLWLATPTNGNCTRLTSDNGRMQGPARVHNFDPIFAPEGSLVFASTRAGTLTLKNLLPNSNLYRVGPDLDFGKVETMTVLSNSELSPAFMGNGQMSFTAEKATPDFYQLSGRRINWDLTDYHPLVAQRPVSDDTFGKPYRAIGYQQGTEIREDLDRNFLIVLSNAGALGGGGALGVFNRSVGPMEEGRNEITFLHSLVVPDRAAHGRPQCAAGVSPAEDATCSATPTAGVYRSPYPTPNGEILASYAANVTNPKADTPRYDLVAIDQRTGVRRILVSGGANSLVEPALGFKKAGRQLFRNLPQLVFGGRSDGQGNAVMHLPDLPVLATLLNFNLRRARNVAAFDKTKSLRVYEVNSPNSATPDAGKMMGPEKVYTDRTRLGSADLEADHSLKVSLPALKPLILELVDGTGGVVFTMREEHQMGPGEVITPGVPRKLFNNICGGCHGALSGAETEVVVSTDVLTGASLSMSRNATPKTLR
jgi:hypothetical protein